MSKALAADRELEQRIRATKLVTDEQLEVVRQLQEESSISLAQALSELDIVSAAEVNGIVSSLKQIRQINIAEVDIDREAIRHIPASVALRYRLIPLRRSGNSLVVAMTDPGDQQALQALRDVTDHDIVPFLADTEAMEHALHLHYGGNETSSARGEDHGEAGTIRSSEDSWRLESPHPLTLESFVECDANRQVRNLALHVAGNSREMYSCPILFVGPSGSGKSHILSAVKTYVATKHPMMRGLLTSGKELLDLYADYALSGMSQLLRYELRDRHFVLIDGLGSIAGVRAVETELLGLIASSRNQSSWIVCTLTAEDLINPAWHPEVRQELDKGLVVHMDVPDATTQTELLRRITSEKLSGKIGVDTLSKTGNLESAIESMRTTILNDMQTAEIKA